MSKETVNVYASLGAQAAGHMAHDQILLSAASPEARKARETFAAKNRKK